MHCLLFAPLLFAHETYLALVCVVYWTMMHCLWCDLPAMGIANSAYVCAYHEAAIRNHEELVGLSRVQSRPLCTMSIFSGRAVGWCGCVGYVCEAHVIGSGLGSGQGRPALGDRSIMVSSGPGFDGKRAELAVEASPNTRLVYSDLRSSDTNNVNSRSRSPVNRSFRTLMPSSYEMGARPKHYNKGATAPLPSWCMGAKPKYSSRTMSILPKTTTVNADR